MSARDTLTVTDGNFDAEVIRSNLPVIVDFWADWCAPCRMVTPLLEEIASEYAGRLKVAKLNVDDNREVTSRFDILSIPTVLLFREGRLEKQVVGALPKEILIRELGLGEQGQLRPASPER